MAAVATGVLSGLGTVYDAQRRQSLSGASNSSYFHQDDLHDELQLAGGELPNHPRAAGRGDCVSQPEQRPGSQFELFGQRLLPVCLRLHADGVPEQLRAELPFSLKPAARA